MMSVTLLARSLHPVICCYLVFWLSGLPVLNDVVRKSVHAPDGGAMLAPIHFPTTKRQEKIISIGNAEATHYTLHDISSLQVAIPILTRYQL